MIDWEKYDPARNACEEESHLCNSLNAEFGYIMHLINDQNFTGVNYVPNEKTHLERLADYGFRAQATITYLQEKVKNYF